MLNLFQHPSSLQEPVWIAKWMPKQVQHDEIHERWKISHSRILNIDPT